MILHTLAWLSRPLPHTCMNTGTQGDKVIKFSDEQLMLSVDVVCVLQLLTDIRDFKKGCWKRVCQPFIKQINESEPVFHNLSFRDSITSQAETGAAVISSMSVHWPNDVQSKVAIKICFKGLLVFVTSRVLVPWSCTAFVLVLIKLLAEIW